jgi:hypothetical protein
MPVLPERPFSEYTGEGNVLLGMPAAGDGTARLGYGRPVFAECGFRCAYCGFDMDASYRAWLNLSVDHVAPAHLTKLGWPAEWVLDGINLVTCCRACNEFLNGYRVLEAIPPTTLEQFVELRDRIFDEKKERAIRRHDVELRRYEKSRLAGPMDVPAVIADDAVVPASAGPAFEDYVMTAGRAACAEWGYSDVSEEWLGTVLGRIPQQVQAPIARGIAEGHVALDGYRFRLPALGTKKGPYAFFSKNRASGAPAPNWEYFVQVAEYVRVIGHMPGELNVGFEDELMDVSVRAGENLVWYIEAKETATQAQRLLEGLSRYAAYVDMGAPDRGNDSLRKAKYLVVRRPRFMSVVAIDFRADFGVSYPTGNSFGLDPLAEAPDLSGLDE